MSDDTNSAAPTTPSVPETPGPATAPETAGHGMDLRTAAPAETPPPAAAAAPESPQPAANQPSEGAPAPAPQPSEGTPPPSPQPAEGQAAPAAGSEAKPPQTSRATRTLKPRAGTGQTTPPRPLGGSKIKKNLMLSIIILTVALSAAIAYRLLFPPVPYVVRNPEKERDEAFRIATEARKTIGDIEKRLSTKGEEFKPEDVEAVKKARGSLEESHQKLQELGELLRGKGFTDTQEFKDITGNWIRVTIWILDANGLLDGEKKPPYGGLYTPMMVTDETFRKADAELKELGQAREGIIKKNDPKELAALNEKLKALGDTFVACRDKYTELDDYLTKGLDLPNVNVKELTDLRESTKAAQSRFQDTRSLRK